MQWQPSHGKDVVTWRTSNTTNTTLPRDKGSYLQASCRDNWPLCFSSNHSPQSASSWHPIASPQLSLPWLKWSPAVLGSLGFSSPFFYDRHQEDELSLEKKPQLKMLIKALWFFCFLHMLSKNESLSADLKPGQRGLGPGKVWAGCQNHVGRPQQFPRQMPGSPHCPSSWWSDAGGCQCKEPWTELHSSLAIESLTTNYNEWVQFCPVRPSLVSLAYPGFLSVRYKASQ